MNHHTTVRRDGKYQVTCTCSSYNFPHRVGGGTCLYGETPYECGMCTDGECEIHETSSYDPRSEALTAAQRNPGLNADIQRMVEGYEHT